MIILNKSGIDSSFFSKIFLIKTLQEKTSIATDQIDEDRGIFNSNPGFGISIKGIRRIKISIGTMGMIKPFKIG